MRISPYFYPSNCFRKMWHAATPLLLTGAGALIALGLAAQTAWAHSLTVAATASCSNGGGPVITYTVTSWDLVDSAGSYPLVEIDFNGVPVDNEALTLANGNEFTATLPASALTNSVTVTAVTDQNPPGSGTYLWGDDGNYFSTSSVGVQVPTNCAPGIGRFTGGGKVVVSNAVVPVGGQVTVTKGFEVDCDMNPAHENLELNWAPPVGEHFHMDMITSAKCSLNANPAPPFAPVNTIVATGTGSYDNQEGYTVVFTLIDNGEPGVNDQAGFEVCKTDPANPNSCSTSPSIVLNFPVQAVSTGNIQAHVDQK